MTRSMFTQHRTEHNYDQSLDYYPTPGWATRALCEYVIEPKGSVLEPAAGAGHMSNVLLEYFGNVTAKDIQHGDDFLANPQTQKYDWVITNPPFARAKEFVFKSLECADNIAMLVRLNFLASINRTTQLFLPCPPSKIAIFSERIGFKYGVTEPNVPTATDFCWVIWTANKAPTETMWIPVCKQRLSREKDWY
jgi:hypothetical protein